ncbi:MAG: PrsW family intramembrane metalloprotease [Candidatus Heimdallarchaeota archaeon]|nr:PrsW family intramembrane metalloprotease [Candidatus Heimdallarchaeota archaeon]
MAIDESNSWLVIFAIIIVFSFITILFYYKKDKYEPEPLSRIGIAFLFGLLSIIPALLLSALVILVVGDNPIISAILIAPVVEEICKIAFVLILARNESFDGPLDGLIYGAMVGAGFAAGENVIYGLAFTVNSGASTGIILTFIRSLTQIIGHPLYTGLAGAGVGEAKVGITDNQYQQLWRAMLLHALWNGSSSIPDFGTYIGIGIVVVISLIILRNELQTAILLDKQAFESGYYRRKEEMKQLRFQMMVQPPFQPMQPPMQGVIQQRQPFRPPQQPFQQTKIDDLPDQFREEFPPKKDAEFEQDSDDSSA